MWQRTSSNSDTDLHVSANTFTNPRLHLSQVSIHFNQTKFAATFDQLVWLHYQLLLNTHTYNAVNLCLNLHQNAFLPKYTGQTFTRNCNPGLEFSIPGFGTVEFPIPGSHQDWRSIVKTTKTATWVTVFGSLFLNYK